MSNHDEKTQVHVEVSKDVKETAKEKLGHGGLSREIRDCLERIAFGAELNKRSRLERRRDELESELRDARQERREIDARIETKEDRISGIDAKLSNLTKREDKYEAKLEELESQLREDGIRVFPSFPNVKRAASTGEVEPEGVVETLKERNPDVPEYAFKNGINDYENDWEGVPEVEIGKNPDEREQRYR